MLTDTALRNLKPKSKIYKAFDRDGMYVTVSPTGTVTFRYDYRLHGRRETLTIGRYGPAGLSLAMAREKLIDAKKTIAQGKSPAMEKQREKRRLTAVKCFGDVAVKWLDEARMADRTRAMRKHVVQRDILPVFQKRLLNEITPDDLRALCQKVKARGAPATAVHIRDIVKQVYAFAILHGEKVDNPAEGVAASSIATFVAKDRALAPLVLLSDGRLRPLDCRAAACISRCRVSAPVQSDAGGRLFTPDVGAIRLLTEAAPDDDVPFACATRPWTGAPKGTGRLGRMKDPRVARPPSHLHPPARTRRVFRCRTSGLTVTVRGSCLRCSIHASTSARSHTTQRGVRLKRRGNSPRRSIS